MSPERPIPSSGSPLNSIGGIGPKSKPAIPDHELIRCIGEGAYGEVWLARNVLGTYRAVKIVYRKSFRDERTYEREFRGTQQFEPISRTNDGLLDILQAGRNDDAGYYYYVMELADDAGEESEKVVEWVSETGALPTSHSPTHTRDFDPQSYTPRTLATLRQQGRLPPAECVRLGLSLTLALGHLHRHKLIHRDIKPANIIFVQDIPKLADIGLVTTFDDTCSFVGTEGFIAPEGPTSPRADLYSLGKVLYEISTGRDRKDFPEPATGFGEQPLTPALSPSVGEREKGRGDASAELNTIILKACATSAQDRYQTAEEFHADLALLNSGKSVRWKRLVEKRLAFARKTGAVVGVMAVLALGGYLVQRHQTREAVRLKGIAEDLAARMQIQNAENLFARGDSSLALAHLAQVLRRDPDNRVAAERIMAALTERNFARLVTKPLRHGTKLNLAAYQSAAHFSPDGQRLVTISGDETVHVWNVETGEESIPPHRHRGTVLGVEFSPDGKKILSVSRDGTACLLDARTGALIFPPFKHDGPVSAAKFDPSGRFFATGAASQVRVFSVESGQLLYSPLAHKDSVSAVAFSPDGQQFATASEDEMVRVWEASSGQLQQQFNLGGPARFVRFSGDGKWLAAAGRAAQPHVANRDWQLQIWEVAAGRPSSAPVLFDHVYSIAFSPDSKRIVATDSANVARVIEVATGQPLFELKHAAAVYAAAFSPDGAQILTASVDQTARLWNATNGAAISEPLLHEGRVVHAEFSPDGQRVLTAGWEDKSVKVWDIRPTRVRTRVLAHGSDVKSAEFDATGQQVLTATTGGFFTANEINEWHFPRRSGVSLWELSTDARKFPSVLPEGVECVTAQFTGAGPKVLVAKRDSRAFSNQAWFWDLAKAAPTGETLQHDAGINCAHLSADGRQLVTGATDGTIKIWDERPGLPITPPFAHKSRVNSVRFSPNGARFVSASDDGTAVIWDAVSGRPVASLTGHVAEVWFAQFSPQGDKVVTASRDSTARLWTANGSPIAAPLRHNAALEYAEFSPDGAKIVTASGDRTARVWSAATGRQLTEPLQHGQLVMTARFSPDGLRVITASMDGTAQIWDAATGLKLADSFRHFDWVVSANFSHDGRMAVTASADRTSKIREVPLATSPIPPWLSELAEAMGGQRLNPDRIPEPVSWTEFADLKARLSRTPSSDSYFQWAQLLFADPTTPTISPKAAVPSMKPAE